MSSRPFGVYIANKMVREAVKTEKMTAIPAEWHRQIDLILTWTRGSYWGDRRNPMKAAK